MRKTTAIINVIGPFIAPKIIMILATLVYAEINCFKKYLWQEIILAC